MGCEFTSQQNLFAVRGHGVGSLFQFSKNITSCEAFIVNKCEVLNDKKQALAYR
jgi:hypothetical protein